MEMFRVGLIAIVLKDPMTSASAVNGIISLYGSIIVGRMGIPYEKRGISVISLLVDGTTDDIGAFTGKIGLLKGVTVKSNLVKISSDVKL